MDRGAWWAAVHRVVKSCTRLSNFPFTFHFHALEKEMATHSRVLAWRIPEMGEPWGLPCMGSHRVGHDWSDLAAAEAAGLSFGGHMQLFLWCVSSIVNCWICRVVDVLSYRYFRTVFQSDSTGLLSRVYKVFTEWMNSGQNGPSRILSQLFPWLNTHTWLSMVYHCYR